VANLRHTHHEPEDELDYSAKRTEAGPANDVYSNRAAQSTKILRSRPQSGKISTKSEGKSLKVQVASQVGQRSLKKLKDQASNAGINI